MSRIFEHSTVDTATPSLDITGDPVSTHIDVRYDEKRKVLYVDMQGITVLRICRIGTINIQDKPA